MRHQNPIVSLIDLLGKKWVMRFLWELHQEPCSFSALQMRCGDLSPTIVSARIKDLCAANLVVKQEPAGYALSPFGLELLALFDPMRDFADRWAKSLDT